MQGKISESLNLYEVIRYPVVTEKSQTGSYNNKFTFIVSRFANKQLIKKAVETLFKVSVEFVNVINVKGKEKKFRGTKGRRKSVKKAIVTLKEGSSIDFSSGL